jgi:hypothetical protein
VIVTKQTVDGIPTELVNPGVFDVNNDVVVAPAGWIGSRATDAAAKPTTKRAASPDTATARMPLTWACQGTAKALFDIWAPWVPENLHDVAIARKCRTCDQTASPKA